MRTPLNTASVYLTLTLPTAFTSVDSYTVFRQFNRDQINGDTYAKAWMATRSTAQKVTIFVDRTETAQGALFAIGY